MKRLDKTSMGGAGSRFRTTPWSAIRRARTSNEARRNIIIGNLIEAYWKPVYCYLRRKGCNNEEAKDLTQGFFYEIVLGRELIQWADETRGKFRTLLLTALGRYVAGVHRKETRKKKRPEAGIVRLESTELANVPITEAEATPDRAFYHAWAADLLDQVLMEVEEEYCSTGRVGHWNAFRAKILAPIVEDVEAPSLAEICTQYGIADETTASNMITTVKRRFRAVLKRRLRNFVRSDSEAEEELIELYRILSESSAG